MFSDGAAGLRRFNVQDRRPSQTVIEELEGIRTFAQALGVTTPRALLTWLLKRIAGFASAMAIVPDRRRREPHAEESTVVPEVGCSVRTVTVESPRAVVSGMRVAMRSRRFTQYERASRAIPLSYSPFDHWRPIACDLASHFATNA